MQILIVDDNATSLQSLSLVLSDLGHEITSCNNPLKALKLATSKFYPLIITDIRMPDINGLELLSRLKSDQVSADSDVVLITGHGDMETAVEALRRGAYDYLNKPINLRELMAVTEKAAEHQALRLENRDLKQNLELRVQEATAGLRDEFAKVKSRLRAVEGIGDIIAVSKSMCDIYDQTLLFHQNPGVPVLIEGETGTGKEIIARLIHYGDLGSEAPFIAINCSAIPHELFESELFGHEAGAFTGSRAGGSAGKLELAGEGTLFLDEIAEMPLTMQPKLLRVLQERSFFRLGGLKKREFKARVICAGNRNMAQQVEAGTFRRDLYHRLRVGHISIPPLRERPEDLSALSKFFLERENKRKKKNFDEISPEAFKLITHYSWPGNVRELENAIERAVLLNNGPLLKPEHLEFLEADQINLGIHSAPDGLSPATPTHSAHPPTDEPLPEKTGMPDEHFDLEEHIQSIVEAALEKFNGNKSKTAEYLGISRYALMRRLQK